MASRTAAGVAGEDIACGQMVEFDNNGRVWVADDAGRVKRILRGALAELLDLEDGGDRRIRHQIRLAINEISAYWR